MYNKNGIQIGALRKHKEKKGSGSCIPGKQVISNEEVLETDLNHTIPPPLKIRSPKKTAAKISAKIVAELANGPDYPRSGRYSLQK